MSIILLVFAFQGFADELRDEILSGNKESFDLALELSDDEQAELYFACLHALVRQAILREQNPNLMTEISKRFVDLEQHVDFLKEQINLSSSASGRQKEAVFKIASELRTDEVKELLMELLFDDKIFDSPGALQVGVYSPKNSHLAARALGRMDIVDSPLPSKNPLFYDMNDILQWRDWASKQQSSGDRDDEFGLEQMKSLDASMNSLSKDQDSAQFATENYYQKFKAVILVVVSVFVAITVLVIRRRSK